MTKVFFATWPETLQGKHGVILTTDFWVNDNWRRV